MTNANSEPRDDEDRTLPIETTEAGSTEPTETTTTTPPTAQPAPAAPAEPWLTIAAPLPPVRPAGPPPVRWGGIVWGLILLAFSALTLFVVSSPARLAAAVGWFSGLTPGTTAALWVALAGLIIAVSAILGGVSAAQRRRRRNPA